MSHFLDRLYIMRGQSGGAVHLLVGGHPSAALHAVRRMRSQTLADETPDNGIGPRYSSSPVADQEKILKVLASIAFSGWTSC